MIKQHQDQLATAVPVAGVSFDECGFTTAQARQILATGKTYFFEKILPELESYLEGTRRVVTGRSIRAYRERKLAEPQSTSTRMRQMTAASVEARRRRKSKPRKENGATGKRPRAP